MVFGELFERFVAETPACVMYRATMENMFAPAKIDELFRRTAVQQYERELLFSTLVDLVGQVVSPQSEVGARRICEAARPDFRVGPSVVRQAHPC